MSAKAPVPPATTGTILAPLGATPEPSVAWLTVARSAASSSVVSSSDSTPGSRTGPAATPGTKSAWATCTSSTPGSENAQRRAAMDGASGS